MRILSFRLAQLRDLGRERAKVDVSGEYIVAAGGNGTVTLFDLNTDLATSYKGHESRVTAITLPTPEYPFVLSADVGGVLRGWPLPARFARVATTLNSQFNTDIFSKRSRVVIATTYFPTLLTFSPASGVRSVGPHEPYNFSLEQSSSGDIFATYGLGELVEFWSAATMTRKNVINTKQGSLTRLSFVGDSDDIVTAGHDGRLVRWTPSGTETLLARLDQPIVLFALLPASPIHIHGAILFSSFDGALWHTTMNDRPVQFRQGDGRITALTTLPDHQTVLAGNIKGDVVAINTSSWTYNIILHASGAVRDISATPDGRWIVVGTNDGFIHLSTLHEGSSWAGEVTWQRLQIRARHQAVTSDGLLIAVGSNGVIWLYSMAERRWRCLAVGNADFRWVAASAEADSAAALDVEGRLIWIDLDAARRLLGSAQQNTTKDQRNEETHQAP
jgi:WD40 repeat protein